MKIKRKVQKNLSQLIEWLLESGHRNYTANSNMGNTVTLSRYGAIQFSLGTFFPEETFTVEVEEELTEDTEFKSMVEVTTDDLFAVWEHASISTWKSEHSKEFHAYIDGEFKLIWTHEKGMVE